MRTGGIYASGEMPGVLPGSTFAKMIPGGDVACPAGTATTIATTTVNANPTEADTNIAEQGYYVACFVGVISVLFGASMPTALQFTASWNIPGIGAGNDTHIMEPGWLAAAFASTTQMIPVVQFVSTSAGLYSPVPGTPSTLSYTCNPTGQAVTVKRSALATGTQIAVMILRRDD